MSPTPAADIASAQALLQSARHAVVFSGAGMSTPSGIPDFRSHGSGLWQHSDPMKVASLTTFRLHPQDFWDWKRPLLLSIWDAQPNAAHIALAQMEARGYLKALITQNIDGLHERAGSRCVLPVHGTVDQMTCRRCHKRIPSRDFEAQLRAGREMPRCSVCQTVLKPDIVLFEERLPQDIWETAESHCSQADVILVVGSSLAVWPAASLPELAVENGAKLIIVNLTPTHLDQAAAVHLAADVAVALPAIAEGLA
jgi:NAD-dependent deacetylase